MSEKRKRIIFHTNPNTSQRIPLRDEHDAMEDAEIEEVKEEEQQQQRGEGGEEEQEEDKQQQQQRRKRPRKVPGDVRITDVTRVEGSDIVREFDARKTDPSIRRFLKTPVSTPIAELEERAKKSKKKNDSQLAKISKVTQKNRQQRTQVGQQNNKLLQSLRKKLGELTKTTGLDERVFSDELVMSQEDVDELLKMIPATTSSSSSSSQRLLVRMLKLNWQMYDLLRLQHHEEATALERAERQLRELGEENDDLNDRMFQKLYELARIANRQPHTFAAYDFDKDPIVRHPTYMADYLWALPRAD
jgi:hypothetical protein